MSELKSVLWSAFVVPPLRRAVEVPAELGRRAGASLWSRARRVESKVERLLMDPGPPRTWHGWEPTAAQRRSVSRLTFDA